MRRYAYIVLILFAILTNILLYQNCADMSTFEPSMSDPTSFISNNQNQIGTTGNNSLQQIKKDLGLTPNLVANCLQSTSSEFNACIFWKNRIAQRNLAIAHSNEQSHAVKIVNDKFLYENFEYKTYFVTQSPNGDLENSVYKSSNITLDENRQNGHALQQALPDVTGKYNFPYNDGTRKIAQVGAFYWTNAQSAFMTKWTGTFYTKTKQLKVIIRPSAQIPYLNASFGADGVIFMGAGPEGDDFGLDPTILSHEAGHGNLFAASPSTLNYFSANTAICGGSTCCLSTKGCVGAIHEGQADYHIAILFEDNTAVGESLTLTADGIFGRDVAKNSNINIQTLFNQYPQGEVHSLGVIYASVWWEMRKKAKQLYGESGVKNIDTIFTNHLVLLDNNSTFEIACTQHIPSAAKAVLGIDAVGVDIYENKYKSIVDTQCSRISH